MKYFNNKKLHCLIFRIRLCDADQYVEARIKKRKLHHGEIKIKIIIFLKISYNLTFLCCKISVFN